MKPVWKFFRFQKIEIARKMKAKGTDTGFISEITGLSKEEIEKI
jgi:hypothetical protein